MLASHTTSIPVPKPLFLAARVTPQDGGMDLFKFKSSWYERRGAVETRWKRTAQDRGVLELSAILTDQNLFKALNLPLRGLFSTSPTTPWSRSTVLVCLVLEAAPVHPLPLEARRPIWPVCSAHADL